MTRCGRGCPPTPRSPNASCGFWRAGCAAPTTPWPTWSSPMCRVEWPRPCSPSPSGSAQRSPTAYGFATTSPRRSLRSWSAPPGRPSTRPWRTSPAEGGCGWTRAPLCRSAGPTQQPFPGPDQYGARVPPQPPSAGEVRQGLVDGLPGGADQLRKLLLGEVVANPYAVGLRCAEPLGEGEQGLRHSTRHISEDQVGHGVVGAAQSARQNPQEAFSDLGVGGHPRPQRVMAQAG